MNPKPPTTTNPKPPTTTTTTTLLITLILLANIHQTTAYITLTQIRTLLSLSHSLCTRVSNLRLSRGEIEGAQRAKLIARKLEIGLGIRFWPTLFSLCWDYVRNYAWREAVSFRDAVGVVSDFNELLSLVNELTRLRSDSDRASWVAGNYRRVLRIAKSLFSRSLSVFTKSGPLRELMETFQKEMVEGEFLKDCLEVGFNDLKGVVQILKDLASQYTTYDPKQEL